MKKIVCALTLILILTIAAVPVFAANNIDIVKFETDKLTVTANDTLTVTCYIKNVDNEKPIYLGGFQFDITFDNTRLLYTGYDFATFSVGNYGKIEKPGTATTELINSQGYFRLLYLYEGLGFDGIINEGRVVTLTFKVKQDCYAGQLLFDAKNVTIGDTKAQKVGYSKSSDLVTVEGKEQIDSSDSSSESTTNSSSSAVDSGSISSEANSGTGSGLSQIVVGGTGQVIDVDDGNTNISVKVGANTNKVDLSEQ